MQDAIAKKINETVPLVKKIEDKEVSVKVLRIRKKQSRLYSPMNTYYVIPYLDGNYHKLCKFFDMPDNKAYAWLQIKDSIKIKGETYSSKTIFAWVKNESAHQFRAQRLNVKKNNIFRAGTLVLKNREIQEWNLRSGAYNEIWASVVDPYQKVGFPIEAYNKSGETEIKSPDLSKKYDLSGQKDYELRSRSSHTDLTTPLEKDIQNIPSQQPVQMSRVEEENKSRISPCCPCSVL